MGIVNDFPQLALPLYQYAKMVGYTECAFYGVSHPSNDAYACREIWSESQRLAIADALAEAQEDIESVLNFHMMPTWDIAEQHPLTSPMMTKWSRLIALGIKKVTELEYDATVDHTNDPAEIVIAFTGIDINNIHVYYPDTDMEIFPSEIVDDGSDIHIYIPRCRMVDWAHLDNPADGWDYADTSLFQATVDVVLEEIDNSVNVTFQHRDNCGCTITDDTGCGIIEDALIGKVRVYPATFAGTTWTITSPRCRYQYWSLRLNYLSGLTELTRQDKSMLIRLAHSKMPSSPCGCDVLHNLWARDTNVPQIMTAQRLNCEFGMSDGAWVAWKYANKKAALRFGVMA